MAFDLSQWKARLNDRLKGWPERMRRAGVQSVYAFLSASALWPVVEAARQGEWAALMALGSVTAGVGANLLANQIQAWKDAADAARALEQAAPQDENLRKELDAVLQALDALTLAQEALTSDEDRAWFVQTLRNELPRLGSGLTIQGDRNVVAEQIVQSVVVTGNRNDVDVTIHAAPDPQAQAEQEAERALRAYLERLQRECRTLPLAALGGDETVEEDVTLDQVYIALDTRRDITPKELKAIREGQITSLQALRLEADRKERKRVPLPVLEAVVLARQAVILGDPGAGKSTFVKKLLEMQAQAHRGGQPVLHLEPDLLPLLVVLRDLAPALQALPLAETPRRKHDDLLLDALAQYLADEWQRLSRSTNEGPLRQALAQGRFLLVLDGLDEVPPATRPRVRQLVAALRRAYPQGRLLLTSRIRSYTGPAVMEGLPAFTLRPFDEDKIRAFVRAWYRAQAALGRFTKAQADKRITDLTRAALSDDLRELAANPMMLTTMAIIHQRETGLPKERVKLYNLAVDVLVRRWQQWKVGDKLAPSDRLRAFLQDDNRLRPALEELAYWAHRQGLEKKARRAADLPRGRALEILEKSVYAGDAGVAAEFLDYVDQRAGLLVGRGGAEGKPEVYSFPHRTFQEYLAGCYLVGQRNRVRTFARHAREGDVWDVAAMLGAEELHYNRRGTHEVLDLAYGLCPAQAPTDEGGWRALLWSGQMAALVGVERILQDKEAPNGGAAYLQRVRQHLAALLATGALPAVERAEAGRALAKIGDPRPEVTQVDRMALAFVPAGPFVMGSDPQRDPQAEEREQPQHELSLDYDYWISRYPITNAQFEAFVDDRGYTQADLWPEAREAGVWQDGRVKAWDEREPRDRPFDFGEPWNLPNHPVVGITWYEALAFARWLTRRWQARGWLPEGWQVTLPSEAEWEKAARGGLEIPSRPYVAEPQDLAARPELTRVSNPNPDRIYPWGDDFDAERANTEETGLGTTSAVGVFPRGASPYGVLDLSGNVLEWTRSLWGDYPYPQDQRARRAREDLSASDSVHRVLRGGSFNGNPWFARAAVRLRLNPDNRGGGLGFRVVVVPVSVSGR